MLKALQLAVIILMAFILSLAGYGLTTWTFWLIAVCTILYGELRVRESLKDIEKLLHKGDYHK